jgi:hypothetical protein
MQTLFIESWCDDEKIIEENVRRVKISSPDVSGTLQHLICNLNNELTNIAVRFMDS